MQTYISAGKLAGINDTLLGSGSVSLSDEVGVGSSETLCNSGLRGFAIRRPYSIKFTLVCTVFGKSGGILHVGHHFVDGGDYFVG